MKKSTILITILSLLILPGLVGPGLTRAQEPLPTATPDPEAEPEVPDQVEVQPTAQDDEIDRRLTRIMEATGWFVTPEVVVRDGVVFLDGRADTMEHREWAGNLARNTQDVVAVVNRLEVLPPPAWDFSPALGEIKTLWRGAIQAIPLVVFAGLVLLLSWWLSEYLARLSRRMLEARMKSPLLIRAVSRTIAIPIFLLGLYLVLQVSGLTRLALTLLGGTGIVGIVIGFAFRDIAENFLASILLSVRQPFLSGDVIEVAGHLGVVQQMNTRSTVLMTFEGNHIQIPNATIFKSTIVNFTANPNRRVDFTVGIGYENNAIQAQEIVAQVLSDHPAVLETPEPLVLVEGLGAATVNLRIYFWIDTRENSLLKVKSSLIRLTKRALEDAAISLPDEAREVIFPQGLQISGPDQPQVGPAKPAPSAKTTDEPVSSAAEGQLRSEDQEIREQAQQSRTVEDGQNLLENGEALKDN